MKWVVFHGLVKDQVVVGVIRVSVAVLLRHAPVGVVGNQPESIVLLDGLEAFQKTVEQFQRFLPRHVHFSRVHFHADLLNVV